MSKPEISSIITDVIHVTDVESQVDMESNRKKRGAFLHLLACLSSNALGDAILKERLDYETTGDAGIIPNKKIITTKFIKLKTRLFYKQQKFNLLREESEGYSKLITELSQDEPLAEFDVDYMFTVIRSLIGCFNLDPNRVLDIILDAFEQRPRLESSFVALIRRFLDNKLTLSQVMGFKFSFYEEEVTPESLYLLAAILLSNHLLHLKDLYSYVSIE